VAKLTVAGSVHYVERGLYLTSGWVEDVRASGMRGLDMAFGAWRQGVDAGVRASVH
jgi:hypothetical protein